MSHVEITQGNSPLVLGLPHTGTDIPADCLALLNDTGRAMAVTDWHIDGLY
ncbi:MAG: N-formylglutamate deformylase, partial [Planktomarina temperata]|nr:N-formylglutamate deformylase [Planktomarina temperata]